MKTVTITSTALIATLISCTPRVPANPVPEQPPETPAQHKVPTPRRAPTTQWKFSPHHNTNSYRSVTETVITELDALSPRTDSTHTTAELTLDVDYLSTSTNVSGQITTLATETSTTLRLPLAFSATISSGHFNLNAIPQLHDELCEKDANQTLGEIRSALYSLPMELDSNTTWSDSTSATTCSGAGLPTALKLIRSYKALGETSYNGQPVLLLNREDQIQLTGQGAQEQHQLHLEGTGIAASRITIDAQTGVLTAIETRQELQIKISTSGQARKFRQTTHQQIHITH